MMKSMLTRFVRDTSGATAIEYGMIALFIAVAIIAAVTQLGTTVDGLFAAVANSFGG